MGKTRAFFTIVVVCTLLNGCYNDILDPTQLGRFEPTPTVNVILDSLGVADEPSPTYEGAEDPKPEDLVDIETDYVFGSGDIVRISIFELYQPGQTYVNDYVVTETGRISIPDVGQVQAAGLTEAQLEQEVRDILSPAILKNPSVTVLLLNSESRYFSIVGQGVGQSARFQIPRYSFRLTDAIALAGGIQCQLYLRLAGCCGTEYCTRFGTRSCTRSGNGDYPCRTQNRNDSRRAEETQCRRRTAEYYRSGGGLPKKRPHVHNRRSGSHTAIRVSGNAAGTRSGSNPSDTAGQ
jgi:hypothetical protein